MHASSPRANEYTAYFGRYVSLVPEERFIVTLNGQPIEFRELLGRLSPEQAGYRYAPDKWTVGQVLGHVVDAERVFSYRALCIARGEQSSLPSFDENRYADMAGHERCMLGELLDELAAVRQASIALFAHMDEAAWQRVGSVNQHPISTRALAYILAGHAHHHLSILRERYAAVLGR